MKEMGYHDGYKYAHNYADNYVKQQYLPDGIRDKEFWQAGNNQQEARMAERLEALKNRSDS